MRSRIRLYPHARGAPSARDLARASGGLVIRRNHSSFRERPHHLIVNWGATDVPYAVDINKPSAVSIAVNKLRAFNVMSSEGINVPEYTTYRDEALGWERVVVRRLTSSFGGNGIDIVHPSDEYLPDAPLYTKYVPKTDEYRVHVFGGRVIFTQRKARSLSVPDDEVNWQIRNHSNGFIFSHKDLNTPDDVEKQSTDAVRAIGLDFGACDVVWNEKRGKAYVLEVNTAPALVGETLNRYSYELTRIAYSRTIRSRI